MDKFFQQAAWRLYDYCEHPAVRYKILFHLLDRPYDDGELCRLRPAFLASDIVEELYQEQDEYGGWGRLQSKDYAAKDRFPTSLTANQNAEGLWDWGTQIKDPWGYFGYFSTGRQNRRSRTVDCSMEVLSFLKEYMEHNKG